jgi:F-type H+-transporting ATPase subunit a
VTTPKKRGCLGCSIPVLIIIVVVILGVLVLGLLAGPIGQKVLPSLHFPSWMVPKSPAIHLPAAEVFNIFGISITNTILAGWITVIFLVLFSWLVTRKAKLVPGRLQVIFESILGWIYDLSVSVAGEKNGRRFFPIVCTIFLFVGFNAWLSLIPGYGSLEKINYHPIPENGVIETIHAEGDEPEHKVVMINDKKYELAIKDGNEMYVTEAEILRGANTDLNTPLALAIVSFIFVTYFGFRDLKLGWLRQYFNFGPLFKSIGHLFKGKFDLMGIFSAAIGVFVGMLELLSMFIRLISFTFRLFGNMTAGEILVIIGAFLIPFIGVNFAIYGFEMLVGFVQALVFSILTLVFATMAVTHHEEEAH